jgi:hypothetical protein
MLKTTLFRYKLLINQACSSYRLKRWISRIWRIPFLSGERNSIVRDCFKSGMCRYLVCGVFVLSARWLALISFLKTTNAAISLHVTVVDLCAFGSAYRRLFCYWSLCCIQFYIVKWRKSLLQELTTNVCTELPHFSP